MKKKSKGYGKMPATPKPKKYKPKKK